MFLRDPKIFPFSIKIHGNSAPEIMHICCVCDAEKSGKPELARLLNMICEDEQNDLGILRDELTNGIKAGKFGWDW